MKCLAIFMHLFITNFHHTINIQDNSKPLEGQLLSNSVEPDQTFKVVNDQDVHFLL